MYTCINLRNHLFSRSTSQARNINFGKKYSSRQTQCFNWHLLPYNFTSAMSLYNPYAKSLIMYSLTGAFQ